MGFLGIGSTSTESQSLLGSVGDIVDSVIGDFLDTLTGDTKFSKLFRQEESDFKQYSEVVTDRRGWHLMPADRSSASYYFLLKYKGKVLQIPFNINPRSETVSEPHATSVRYTQGGGKIIQSEGSVSKEIVIQGTCGLYPNERRTRLPDSGIGSGFEGFKFLQNVFRRYCFLRRYGDLTKGLELIYVNRRRQESWVVEPKSFTSEDSVEHNFHFTYTIVLETLYPYDGADTKGLAERLLDSIPFYRQADQLIQGLTEAVDVVNAAAGQISAIVDGFSSSVMKNVIALANSFADIKAGRLPNFANFKRDSVKNLATQLRQTQAALEAAGDKKNSAEVAKMERKVTAMLLVDGVYDSSPQSKANSVTSAQRAQLTNYFTSEGVAVSSTDAINAGAPSFRPDSTLIGDAPPGSATYQAQQVAASDTKNLQTIATIGGSSLDPNGKFQVARFVGAEEDASALPPSTAVILSQLDWEQSWNEALTNIDNANSDYRSAIVNEGDSIQTLAFRLLGDHARWPELTLLNQLQYPYVAAQSYITANNLTNVIPFFGTIIYPVPKSSAQSRVRVWRNESDVSLGLDPFQRSLGSDVLIDEKTGDVVWTANDLALSYGVQNIQQYIRKRVVTRKNMLRRSLRLGYSQYIGVSTGAIETLIKAETPSLFTDDERITTAEAVVVRSLEQNLQIGVAVQVKDNQDPILVTATL